MGNSADEGVLLSRRVLEDGRVEEVRGYIIDGEEWVMVSVK